MTKIPPDLTELQQVRLEELQDEKRPACFKKIIDEVRSSSEKEADDGEEGGEGCVISIFELPRHHFDLSKEEELASAPAPASPVSAPAGLCASRAASPATSAVEAEILFDKMVGAMLVLSSSAESETTLFLNTPEFDHSPLYGTRITIKEFSTAPKAFNVEIAASSAVLAQLNAHKSALLATFAQGKFNFSIGRLETEIQETDRPLFHRKEAVSQDGGGL